MRTIKRSGNVDAPSYYAIIPANVRYAKISANAKLLYGEITALTKKEGYCWATNRYFAELYDASPDSVSRWVRELISIAAISIEVSKDGDGTARKIYLTGTSKMQGGYCKNEEPPLGKNAEHNNTSNNIKYNTPLAPQGEPTKAKRNANPSISLSQFLGNTTQAPTGWFEREPARKLRDAASQWERFRDHFLGNGKRWQRWELVWDNWCRRSADWQGSGPANGHGQARGGGSKPDIVAAASRRALVELFGDAATGLDGQDTGQGTADACPFGDGETAIEAVFVVEPANPQARIGASTSPYGSGEDCDAGTAFQGAFK